MDNYNHFLSLSHIIVKRLTSDCLMHTKGISNKSQGGGESCERLWLLTTELNSKSISLNTKITYILSL